MNYVQKVKGKLAEKIDVEPELLDLYVLLVLVKGAKTTLEDVHDAWSVWRCSTKPEHPSLIPFEDLSQEIQELDREYADAIVATALEI